MSLKAAAIALLLVLAMLWPSATLFSDDSNRLLNLEDASGMFNERGYLKSNSFSLDGNEVINDFNGNLVYTQRLMYLPISENGLHCDLKLAYNGNVSHTIFGARIDANDIQQTPANLPEWVLSVNGIAVQTFNFENELVSWENDTSYNAENSYNDDVACHIEGYHKCYRESRATNGIYYGIISLLMEDGSVHEYYSTEHEDTGFAYMISGEYNSFSKDDPDRGYLWPLGSGELYGYFTLFRADGTQVLFKIYQPKFRTDVDCVNSFQRSLTNYPRILLPVKFSDQMGHEIDLSYIYEAEGEQVLGRPIIEAIDDIFFDWESWQPGNTSSVEVSLAGSMLYDIYFADAISQPEAGYGSRGVSWHPNWNVNRGGVWWILDSEQRSRKFVYQQYSRTYRDLGFDNVSLRTFFLCNARDWRQAGRLYRLDPWRIREIEYPEGGKSFFSYYKDFWAPWNLRFDTLSIRYNHYESCLSNPVPKFPCKKSARFDEIGRDPFFLNMVSSARKTCGGNSEVNIDTLMYSWTNLVDSTIDVDDEFTTMRWFGTDFGILPKSGSQFKNRIVKYHYFPEKGPYSRSSRDRSWTLKSTYSSDGEGHLSTGAIKKDYYWNTNCVGLVCDGTFKLDSLKTTHESEVYWERFYYYWFGDPNLETVNCFRTELNVDPWGVVTYTVKDTTFMRLSNPSTSYYNCGLKKYQLVRRMSTILDRVIFDYNQTTNSLGYVGQLKSSRKYVFSRADVCSDSLIDAYAYYVNDAPSVMHRGAIKLHVDPMQDTTYFYYSASDEEISFRLQDYNGSVQNFTRMIPYSDAGPSFYKMQRHIGAQTLTWYQKVDNRGLLEMAIEPNGFSSDVKYDLLNRVVAITLPGGYTPGSGGRERLVPDTSWSAYYYYNDEPNAEPVFIRNQIRMGKFLPSQENKVWIDGLSRPYRHDVLNSDGTYDSVVTSFDYAGRAVSLTDQLGFVTLTDYDHLDRPVKTTYPDSAHSFSSTTYTVTNAAAVGLAGKFNFPETIIYKHEFRDENDHAVIEYYDVREKLRLKQTYDGQTPLSTYFDYDDLGNLTLVIRPNGDSVRYFYNSLGQLTEEQTADYNGSGGTLRYGSIKYKYDKNGNLIERANPVLMYNVGDAFHARQYSDYDNLNRITESGVSYIFGGVPSKIPRQRYFYDLSSSQLSLGRLSFSYTFDPNSICNYAERYHYDPRGRIKRQVNFFNALLDSALIPGTQQFNYLLTGDSVVISYTYDWADKLTSLTYPDGSVVRYYYDDRGRLISVGGATSQDAAKYAQLTYTRRNELAGLGLGDHLQQIDYLYNERGWLESINDGVSSGTEAPNDLFGQKLYYGSHPSAPAGWEPQFNGNLFGQKLSVTGVNLQFAYQYDESDRLKQSQMGSYPLESFDYDANGNILRHSKPVDGGTAAYEYHYQPGTNRLQLVDLTHDPLADTLTYDRDGNVVRDSGKKADLRYDTHGRLILVRIATTVGIDTIWYGYNSSGTRVYKAFRHFYRASCLDPERDEEDPRGPGHPEDTLFSSCVFTQLITTYYDLAGEKVLRERTTGPEIARWSNNIYSGNSRIAMRDELNRLHYFLSDHLGSTRVVFDSTGLVENKYWYHCFGGSWEELVSLNQPYRYTAKPLDNEDGLNIYYYGARYYDAELGRFLAIDPAASKYPSLSPYAYCANNPMKSVDVDGATFMDRVVGVGVAMLDNASGLNLRGNYTPTDPADYNAGQDGGDAASFIIGIAEMSIGGGMHTGGAAASLATAGAGSEVTLPVMGGGVVLEAHGAFNSLNATLNLAMQKGRVQGGSEATKPHGNTANDSPATRYKMYDKDGNFQKHGVTKDPKSRYTKKELAGGKLEKQNEGPRKKMLKEERKLVEEDPGPLNHEPWAGKNKK